MKPILRFITETVRKLPVDVQHCDTIIRREEDKGRGSKVKSDNQTPRPITLWLKMVAAVVGAGVVIAMGVITMTVGGNEARADDAGVAGITSTKGSSATMETSAAIPIVQATPWRCSMFRGC